MAGSLNRILKKSRLNLGERFLNLLSRPKKAMRRATVSDPNYS